MKGTLINAGAVAAGASFGLLIGKALPPALEPIALSGLGLVTIGIGLKMFFQSKNVLIVAASIAIGGVIGAALGIDPGIAHFAEWARRLFGGEAGRFNEGLMTTSVLYCVGPMTLLGCMQDALEGRSEILNLKSTMDGISAVFFAAALGAGVLVTSLVVLIVQGAFTLLARRLRRLAGDEELLAEITATGGPILAAIGLGLLEIKKIPSADFVVALALAPLFVLLSRRFQRRAAT